MTDRGYVRPKKRHSLYFGLLLNILFGVLTAILIYLVIRLTSNYFINTRYLSNEAKGERVKAHLEDLQSYADKNGISSEDTDKIAYWARENPYVYLMVYKNDVLFFSSDMNEGSGTVGGGQTQSPKPEEEKPGEGEGSDGEDGPSTDDGDEGNPSEDENIGGEGDGQSPETDSSDGSDNAADDTNGNKTDDKNDNKNDNKNDKNDYDGLGSLGLGSKVDREALIKQAEASGMHPIELSDGTIFAEIAEYSEELYFDLFNLVSLGAGIIALAIVLVVYFRRIISRIKRLESDVNIVSHINMDHSIECRGRDEISMLSRNVENMRNTILVNLEKERAARNANTELITAMSHDIRTPLTVLLGYIDMLKDCESCDETARGYIGATEKTALRLKELSEDMFKYSLAFTSTDVEISMEDYNAEMLMEQLFYEHILLLKESGYEVILGEDVEFEEGETVRTDPQNLMRVIDNIFQNIYKYAKPDEPIKFSTYKEKSCIVFSIRNRITDTPPLAESNGIGLKTCKRLCQYIAEDFKLENDGEYFTVSLALKLNKPDKTKRNGTETNR